MSALALLLSSATLALAPPAFLQNRDFHPTWSPAGKRIAFARQQFGDWEIAVANADGTAQVDITRNRTIAELTPDWSPDGTRVAFVADVFPFEADFPTGQTGRIALVAPDGSGRRGIPAHTSAGIDDPGDPYGALNPAWSPDGRAIAVSYLTTIPNPNNYHPIYDFSVYVEAANGGGGYAVGVGSQPDWSPDGKRLVYAGGGGLLFSPGGRFVDGATPSWSTDGARIAFSRTVAGNTDVYVIGVDGKGERRLTSGPELETDPAWSPDGASLAFSRDGEIWTMRADGTGPTRVTSSTNARCTVTGTGKADVLHGTARADVICGLGGNDILVGGGGDDVLDGGAGNDQLFGGGGNDALDGGPGNDRVDGGAAPDLMLGGRGNDLLLGLDGTRDVADGGPGHDTPKLDDKDDRIRVER